MPAIETGETLGRTPFRTWPKSPKNSQQTLDPGCESLHEYIKTNAVYLCFSLPLPTPILFHLHFCIASVLGQRLLQYWAYWCHNADLFHYQTSSPVPQFRSNEGQTTDCQRRRMNFVSTVTYSNSQVMDIQFASYMWLSLLPLYGDREGEHSDQVQGQLKMFPANNDPHICRKGQIWLPLAPTVSRLVPDSA